MDKAIEYRGFAAKFRLEATESALPQRRQVALTAAERWEALAQEFETAIAPTVALRGRRANWVL